MQNEYVWDTHIASYDAGLGDWLRPSNQLKLQQEVGELHFEEGGVGYNVLREHGLAFVLTRANSVIHTYPRFGDKVRIRTWHRGNRGSQFFRCYEFTDLQGRVLIESVSAFALVDIHTHRLLRPSALDVFHLHIENQRESGCPDPVKLRDLPSLIPAGERVVQWSDIDWNGHLNNTVYADIACDFLPGGMAGRRLCGFSIDFLKEARLGDVLAISVGERLREDGGREVFVEGEHERGVCFIVRLQVQDGDYVRQE